MSGKPSRLAVIAALSIMMAAPALTAEGVHIDELLVATSIPESQRDATVKAARAFYEFRGGSRHLLLSDGTVFVGIHRFEDAFVSGLELLQRDGSVTVPIHKGENHPHGEGSHHTPVPHHTDSPILAHHAFFRHTLP